MSGTVFMRNPRSCPTPHTYSESWISWLRTSQTRGGFEMKTMVVMRKRHANFSKPIANHAEFLPPCYLLTMDVGFTDWSTWYKMEIVHPILGLYTLLLYPCSYFPLQYWIHFLCYSLFHSNSFCLAGEVKVLDYTPHCKHGITWTWILRMPPSYVIYGISFFLDVTAYWRTVKQDAC